jgi:hypothetical protein
VTNKTPGLAFTSASASRRVSELGVPHVNTVVGPGSSTSPAGSSNGDSCGSGGGSMRINYMPAQARLLTFDAIRHGVGGGWNSASSARVASASTKCSRSPGPTTVTVRPLAW